MRADSSEGGRLWRDRGWVALCVIVLSVALFFPILFQGHQFIYRDAGHFYYPYFQFIQQEWDAGRFPLWNPYENGGSPLLANPTSSVLYPGKLVFFLPISYPAAYRTYILLHVFLSLATAYWMARRVGASGLAAGACGLSYAFSGPVLLQHANIVFLVGAAWAPAAIVFADRALRLGNTRAAVGLGVVLALQVLGGDPEIAYLCGTLAAFYAAGLALAGRKRRLASIRSPRTECLQAETESVDRPRPRRLVLLALAAGTAAVLSLVQVLPTAQFRRHSSRAFSQVPRTVYDLPGAWLGLKSVPPGYRWYDGLVGAGPPVSHNVYDFSTEPWRWLELLWPNLTGRTTSFRTRWDLAVPGNQAIWTPTLYSGLLPLLLALGLLRWKQATPPRRWFAVMVVFGMVGSLGSFGLVWLGRSLLSDRLFTWNADGLLRSAGDEVGGLYWLLTVVLPGFVEFRYPAKLLVFSALGISGLAATAWDDVLATRSRRFEGLLLALVVVSATLLATSIVARPRIEARLNASADAARDPYDGPLDVPATVRCIQGAFLHTAVVALMALGLLHVLRRRGGAAWVPAALLALVTVDLGVANYWLIATGPQSLFETEPHALGVIREAEESADGERGPFRIFRPALFQPLAWSNVASDDRAAEGIAWERDSLAPKYGLPYRVDNAVVLGTMGLFDYEYFFAPWTEPVDPALRRTNPRLPERVVRYAARSFDLWNVKYFVLPKLVDPADEYRGISSLLVEPDAPTKKRPILFEPPPGQEGVIDYQVVLNSDCFPRAWIVHEVTAIPPVRGFEKVDRDRVIGSLMLDESLDLRRQAVVETDRPEDLATVEPPAGGAAQRAEGFTPSARCEFVHREPDRVTLSVRTPATGLLVLADTYYPGWAATLDGQPAEILRTNRMMRGLVVPAGEHTVTFTYRPALVYGSAAASAVGWAALVFATFLTALACFGSARMERFRQRRQERQKPYRVF